jgi:hypothetical protein
MRRSASASPQGLGHDLAVAGDPPGVVAGVVVAVLDREGQAEDDLGLPLAAPLHDVGKVGIPDGVLLKPGRLDAEEFALIRTHAEMSATATMRAASGIASPDSPRG